MKTTGILITIISLLAINKVFSLESNNQITPKKIKKSKMKFAMKKPNTGDARFTFLNKNYKIKQAYRLFKIANYRTRKFYKKCFENYSNGKVNMMKFYGHQAAESFNNFKNKSNKNAEKVYKVLISDKKQPVSKTKEPGIENIYDKSEEPENYYDKSSSLIIKIGIGYSIGGFSMIGGISYAKFYKKGKTLRPGFLINFHLSMIYLTDYYINNYKLGFSTLGGFMINELIIVGAGFYIDFQLQKQVEYQKDISTPYEKHYLSEFNGIDFGFEAMFALMGSFLYGALRLKIGFANLYTVYHKLSPSNNIVAQSKYFFIGGEGGIRF